jgi:hypothetical protein
MQEVYNKLRALNAALDFRDGNLVPPFLREGVFLNLKKISNL